jgi:hypothetical protein
MVIGYDDVESTDKELLLENLTFACSDRYGSSKLTYYQERLLGGYSNNDVEPEEVIMPVESPPAVVSSSGPMDSAWPMKSHDTRHTGRSPYSTTNNQGSEKWRFKTGGSVADSAVIDDNGIIYFGSWDSYLYAVYPNGTMKWRYGTEGLIWSCPAISEDGTIYVGTFHNYLHAVNPNGTRKWKFDADNSITASPAIAEDGTIYFGTYGEGGRVYAINPDGTEKWHYITGWHICSGPAIGDDGTVYVGSSDIGQPCEVNKIFDP